VHRFIKVFPLPAPSQRDLLSTDPFFIDKLARCGCI
jgi:hypothetical protein